MLGEQESPQLQSRTSFGKENSSSHIEPKTFHAHDHEHIQWDEAKKWGVVVDSWFQTKKLKIVDLAHKK